MKIIVLALGWAWGVDNNKVLLIGRAGASPPSGQYCANFLLYIISVIPWSDARTR